jgi:5-methylcytosine-specific restriction protein A
MPRLPGEQLRIKRREKRAKDQAYYGIVREKKKREKEYDKERGTASERGYDRAWSKVRKLKLKQDPLCEECLKKGRTEKAVVVHHIVEISQGGERLALDNLMSLCRDCHERIHGRK